MRARLRRIAISSEHDAVLARSAPDREHIKRRNPRLHPMQLRYGDEGTAWLRLFQACRLGQQHLADPDGVLLDLVQA